MSADALDDLIALSRWAGQQPNLTQSAGGNTSVKLDDGSLWIKASGFTLSEVGLAHGLSHVDVKKVLRIMSDTSILHTEDKHQREAKAQKRLQRTILDETARPSIETYFHAYLPGRFVLHTHPIQVVALASQSGWKREVLKIFDPSEVVLVEYATPGLELSLVIKDAVEAHKQRYGHIPPMLMLQNHGLIIHEDTIETTVERNTAVLKKLQKHFSGAWKMDEQRGLEMASLIEELFSTPVVAYEIRDAGILKALQQKPHLLDTPPFCPDTVVFCGPEPLHLVSDGSEVRKMRAFFTKYGFPPKLVTYEKTVYLVATTVRKAREAEEVLRLHILGQTGKGLPGKLKTLSKEERQFLCQWEAEKYRQSR